MPPTPFPSKRTYRIHRDANGYPRSTLVAEFDELEEWIRRQRGLTKAGQVCYNKSRYKRRRRGDAR